MSDIQISSSGNPWKWLAIILLLAIIAFCVYKTKDGVFSIPDLFSTTEKVDTVHHPVYIPWTHIETAGMPYEKIRYKTIYQNTTDTIKVTKIKYLLAKSDSLNKEAQNLGADRIAILDTNITIHVDSTIKVDIPMKVYIEYYMLSGKWTADFKFKTFTFESVNKTTFVPVKAEENSILGSKLFWGVFGYVAGTIVTGYLMKSHYEK
jgi:hypothetical protein